MGFQNRSVIPAGYAKIKAQQKEFAVDDGKRIHEKGGASNRLLFVHQTCNFHWSSGMVPSVDFPGVPYGGKGPHHWNQTRIVYYEVNLQLFSKYSSLSL